MITDNNGFGRMAFGVAGFVAAFMFWIVSIVDPQRGYQIYWQWYVLFPIIAFFITFSMPHVPSVLLTWLRQYRDGQQLMAEARKFKSEPAKQQASAPTQTVNLRALAWRDWFIAKLTDAQELGGIHFIGCMDQRLDYRLWRNVFWRVLFDGGLAEPIADSGKRERTTLKTGLTPGGVAAMLKAGSLSLPYPDDVDPPGYKTGL